MKRKAEEKVKKEEKIREEQPPKGDAEALSFAEPEEPDTEDILVPEIENENDGSLAEEKKEDADSAEEELAPEKKLEALLEEKKKLEDRCLRLMADFDNFKKRAAKEKAESVKFGNEPFIKDILPVVDSIERVLSFDFEKIEGNTFKKGIELVLAEIKKTFSKHGVEVIESLGKPFDPMLHQAMQRLETSDVEPDTIVEEFQKGYLYHGRLLRPAMVTVSAPEAESLEEAAAPVQENEALDNDHNNKEGDEKDNSYHSQ